MKKLKEEARLEFGGLVDKLFYTILVGLGVYGSSQLNSLIDSFHELSKVVAVMATKETATQEKVEKVEARQNEFDARLRYIEIKTNGAK